MLDDPSESYLWRGLEECGRASVEALNRASELMSHDMFKFTQVRSLSLYLWGACVFGLNLWLMLNFLNLQALQAASLEKSTFLRGERDAWAACDDEKATREVAEGELAKESEISAELR